MKNSKELMEIISENPELPIVFLVDNDSVAYDYGWSYMGDYYVSVKEFYEYDEYFSDDEDEVKEFYENFFSDSEEFKYLSDKDYEKVISDYVKDNIKHYKAIVIHVSA